VEGGIGTRRRPIGRDYAAAKDAECGMWNEEKNKILECGMNKKFLTCII
jgi:hypothetical protein